jgi:phage terminase small subunit
MGVGGTKPKAAALRLLGKTGHRPINLDEPKPELVTGIPVPPRKLNAEGKREWERIVPDLVKTRILASIDLSYLATYCSLHAAIVAAEKKGDLLPASYISQYRALASEFGIGPSSRSRIKAGSGEETNAEEKRFFGS